MSLFSPDLQKLSPQVTVEVLYWRCSITKWIKSSLMMRTDMGEELRYIVWREQTKKSNDVSVRALLSRFPTVKILKFRDPDYAVVLMDPKTERKIQQHFPELSIEEDVQHRLICSR